MEQAWSIEGGRNDLIADKFIGYERKALNELLKRLPPGQSIEDIKQEIRLWALEAINKYTPGRINPKTGRTAQFPTFLTKHLLLRSYRFVYKANKRREPHSFQHDYELLHSPAQDSGRDFNEFANDLGHFRSMWDDLLDLSDTKSINRLAKVKSRRKKSSIICRLLKIRRKEADYLAVQVKTKARKYL